MRRFDRLEHRAVSCARPRARPTLSPRLPSTRPSPVSASCRPCAGPGDAAAASQVPERWRLLSPFPLRPAQEQTLSQLARGVDVLARQPTSSGKTLCALLPTTAAWCSGARRQARAAARPVPPLPPVGVVVAPWRALGFDLEREANLYFQWLAEEELAPETVSPVANQRVLGHARRPHRAPRDAARLRAADWAHPARRLRRHLPPPALPDRTARPLR